MNVIGEEELIRACQILFGYQLNVGRDFLRYLQLSGVKTAYRRRARETHPDMISAKGKAHGINSASFIEVQNAYENLSGYLSSRQSRPGVTETPRHTTVRRPRSANNTHQHRKAYEKNGGNQSNRKQSSHSKNSHTFRRSKINPDNRYQGQLPRRKLLLGQFLYHSGIISWRMMIQSLGWQMTQRPRVGELANNLGWLSDNDIQRIADNRRTMERFGNIAKQLGLLSEFQVKMLLTIQKRRQRRLGDYFVDHGILSAKELENLVKQCMEHNANLTSK